MTEEGDMLETSEWSLPWGIHTGSLCLQAPLRVELGLL